MPQVHSTHGKFAVVSSSAKMPSSCRGRYRHVVVVALADGYTAEEIAMISDRSRAVEQVIWESGAVNVGLTERCAFSRAIAEAEAAIPHEER